VTDIHSLCSTPKEARPKCKVRFNAFVAIKLDSASCFRGTHERRQGRKCIRSCEHVKRFDSYAPRSAHIHDLVPKAFVLKPTPWWLAAPLYNLAPVASPLRAIPHDDAPTSIRSGEIGAMLPAVFDDQPLILEAAQLIFEMITKQPGKHSLGIG